MQILFVAVLSLMCCSCQLSKKGVQIEPSKVPELAYLNTVGRTVGERHYLGYVSTGVTASAGRVSCEWQFYTCDNLDIPDARRQMLEVTDDIYQFFLRDPASCAFILRQKDGLNQLRQRFKISIHCVNYSGQPLVPPAVSGIFFEDDTISYVMMDKTTKKGGLVHQETYQDALQKHAARKTGIHIPTPKAKI